MCSLEVPGSPGAPRILQDEEVHAELHQVPLYGFSRHAAVHGVDQLGSLSAGKTIRCFSETAITPTAEDDWLLCESTTQSNQTAQQP